MPQKVIGYVLLIHYFQSTKTKNAYQTSVKSVEVCLFFIFNDGSTLAGELFSVFLWRRLQIVIQGRN